MSRSKKWKGEWAFFLNANGRRQYNLQCKKCSRGCKQSFQITFMECPKFHMKDSKKHHNLERKIQKQCVVTDE